MNSKEEEIMLKQHDEQLKQHEERLSAVEQQQQDYNNQLMALKNDLKKVELSQTDIINTVTRYGDQQKNLLDKQELRMDKLFDHFLGAETLKVQQQGALSVAKLDMKGKILVALFGAGGLSGIIAAAVTFLGK